jgi:hypothetical protein
MRNDPFIRDTSRKTLDMAGQPIEFPILYYDTRWINAIFTVRTSRLKKICPHPNFKPVDMWPGRSMLGIIVFEYRDSSIGPYNEIAFVVPIKFPPGFIFPGLAVISMMRKNVFPLYIQHLPVTIDISVKVGVHFWNHPKFLSEITLQDNDDKFDITLEENGILILKMSARKLALAQSSRIQFRTYSIREKVFMHGLVDGLAPRLGTMMMRDMAQIELGQHWISEELARLELSKVARSGMYAEGMMMKMHEPDKCWNVDTLVQI